MVLHGFASDYISFSPLTLRHQIWSSARHGAGPGATSLKYQLNFPGGNQHPAKHYWPKFGWKLVMSCFTIHKHCICICILDWYMKLYGSMVDAPVMQQGDGNLKSLQTSATLPLAWLQFRMQEKHVTETETSAQLQTEAELVDDRCW